MIEIRKAKQDEFKKVAKFATDININENLQCLHCSNKLDDFINDLDELLDEEKEPIVIGLENDKLSGAIVYDLDSEKSRVWLWGPFIPENKWELIGDYLIEKLIDYLPKSIKTIDAFSNQKNQYAIELYLKHGFIKNKISHVYFLDKNNSKIDIKTNHKELDEKYYSQFIELHDNSFKNSYLSGKEIIEQIDENKKVIIYTIDNILIGYIFFNKNHSEDEGYIDFIAVKSEYRNKGIAKILVNQAVENIFKIENIKKINLTVTDDNISAKKLYEGLDFKLLYSGVSLRKNL